VGILFGHLSLELLTTLPIVLLAGGLLKTLVTAPDEMESLLDRIAVGYRLGSKAKPMLAQRWEMH
jgi:ubiquinone biosynthesis protein COQ4